MSNDVLIRMLTDEGKVTKHDDEEELQKFKKKLARQLIAKKYIPTEEDEGTNQKKKHFQDDSHSEIL